MSEPVTLSRCETCGKWSHAKRMPRSHKRWQPDGGTEMIQLSEVDIEERPTGSLVPCGPFAAWTTRPSEDTQG